MGIFSETMAEDLVANAILGVVLVAVSCARDLCKRVSRSDCVYDTQDGLRVKLPTFHGKSRSEDSSDPPAHPL